jgi:hypothetical protein
MFLGLTNTMTDDGNCAEMPRNPRNNGREKGQQVEELK